MIADSLDDAREFETPACLVSCLLRAMLLAGFRASERLCCVREDVVFLALLELKLFILGVLKSCRHRKAALSDHTYRGYPNYFIRDVGALLFTQALAALHS